MAITKRLRYEILKRDGHTCQYCRATDAPLTIDHVVPVALGGSDDPSNLVAACRDCNAGKSSVPADAPLVAAVSGDALRWAESMRIAAQAAVTERTDRQAARDAFREHWDCYAFGFNQKYKVPRDPAWPDTVDKFLNAGLTLDDLFEAVDIAMRKPTVGLDDVWRYFCGVTWRMLSERQEAAQRIASSLATDEGGR